MNEILKNLIVQTPLEAQLMLERLMTGKIQLEAIRRQRMRAESIGDIDKANNITFAINLFKMYRTLK